jgi:phage-related protein
LFGAKEYKQLSFDSDPNKFYYAIFIGSPEFRYIDMSTSTDIDANNRKLIGYITLTARCNAGTAFGPALEITRVNPPSNVTQVFINNGDDIVFPSMRIKIADNAFPDSLNFIALSIENPENNSKIQFAKVYRNEEIIVDMSIRRITATGSATPHNIYES